MPIGSAQIALQKTTISANLGKLRDASTAVVDTTTTTAHGTGANVKQRVRALTSGTTQALPAWGTAPVEEGWRVDLPDMGAGSQRRRINSGTWTFNFRLSASVTQATAQTGIAVRVFAGVPGSMTERFRREVLAAFAVAVSAAGSSTLCTVTCDANSIVGAAGATGTPPQIDLAVTETIQIEVYIDAPGVAVLGQTITVRLETAAFNGGTTTRIIMPNAPTILETQDTTASTAPSGQDAIAEVGSQLVVSSLVGQDALAEIQDWTITTIPALAFETLLDSGGFTTVLVLTQSEAIADPPGDVTLAAALSSLEALAETGDLTTQIVLSALEGLAETGGITGVLIPTANWQRISPGLSGTVYDSTGSSSVSGAQVLLFRDDTNALIATLTSDGSGNWAVELDPAFTYWVSGWKTGSPQVEDRTDRAIPPVLTVVETGT